MVYIALRYRDGGETGFRKLGLAIAVSFGTSMICFIIGLKETAVVQYSQDASASI